MIAAASLRRILTLLNYKVGLIAHFTFQLPGTITVVTLPHVIYPDPVFPRLQNQNWFFKIIY